MRKLYLLSFVVILLILSGCTNNVNSNIYISSIGFEIKDDKIVDSLNNYILQVVDVYVKGEQMPIDYARKEIEKIILSQRQVDFIESERENLYNNAIQSGKLKRYEK